ARMSRATKDFGIQDFQGYLPDLFVMGPLPPPDSQAVRRAHLKRRPCACAFQVARGSPYHLRGQGRLQDAPYPRVGGLRLVTSAESLAVSWGSHPHLPVACFPLKGPLGG